MENTNKTPHKQEIRLKAGKQLKTLSLAEFNRICDRIEIENPRMTVKQFMGS